MISVRQEGNFNNTEKMLRNIMGRNYMKVLQQCGQEGVRALSAATPKDTGLTAASWSYKIEESDGGINIVWENSHIEGGYANIALLLQYGHGTRTGGYVRGRDYINPAIRPVFDNIATKAWKEVTK